MRPWSLAALLLPLALLRPGPAAAQALTAKSELADNAEVRRAYLGE